MSGVKHVWVKTPGDADLFAPATVVHRARGRVDLKVKRYVGEVASEQHIVVSNADFEELAPLIDLSEVQLAEQGQLLDAALMRAPTVPALLHLMRRRFQTEERNESALTRGGTWLGSWLCVQCASSQLTAGAPPSISAQSEASESLAAWQAAARAESRPAPTVPAYAAYMLQRMLTLRRPQAAVVLGDGTCGEALGRMLRFVRHAHEARAHKDGAELAEAAEASVLALEAFTSAVTPQEEAAAFDDDDDAGVALAMDGLMRELRFRKLRERLMLAGVDGDEQKQLWRALAAALHLASLDETKAADEARRGFIASLLGVGTAQIAPWTGGGAGAGRRRVDAAATVYAALVEWLLHRLDEGLRAPEHGAAAAAPAAAKQSSPPPPKANGTSDAAAAPAVDGTADRTPPPPKKPSPRTPATVGKPAAGDNDDDAEPVNPFLAQMKPGRASAKLLNRMSHVGEEDGAADSAAKGNNAYADQPDAPPQSAGAANALPSKRGAFIRLREALRGDGIDATKLALPDATDVVDEFEATDGPLAALAAGAKESAVEGAARLASHLGDVRAITSAPSGDALRAAHFGRPVDYRPPRAGAAAWKWHHAPSDATLLKVLSASQLPLLKEAARRMLQPQAASSSSTATPTAKALGSKPPRGAANAAASPPIGTQLPGERLRGFLDIVGYELASYEPQPLVCLGVTTPPTRELRLKPRDGKNAKQLKLVHAYDSRHVHGCIERLGLVSYCTHAAQPTCALPHAALIRLMHPFKPPLTSMQREKLEALLRRAGQRFVEAKPPSWAIGTALVFITDGALLGLVRAVLDMVGHKLIKLQAHGRRIAARKRVAARKADKEAAALEADIEEEMRRILQDKLPAALTLLAPKDGPEEGAVDPTAERVEAAFKRLERLARRPAAHAPPPAAAREKQKRSKPTAKALDAEALDADGKEAGASGAAVADGRAGDGSDGGSAAANSAGGTADGVEPAVSTAPTAVGALDGYAQTAVLMFTSMTRDQQATVATRKVVTQLEGLGVPFTQLDGTDPAHKAVRSALWAKAGASPGTYPILYVGPTGFACTGEDVQPLIDSGSLRSKLGPLLEGGSAPAAPPAAGETGRDAPAHLPPSPEAKRTSKSRPRTVRFNPMARPDWRTSSTQSEDGPPPHAAGATRKSPSFKGAASILKFASPVRRLSRGKRE